MSNENSQKFKIGCHLSASKGFLNMGKEIVALGGNTRSEERRVGKEV